MHSLHVVGTNSEVARRYSVEVHVRIVVGGWATDSGLEKRSGIAGRGACVHSCGGRVADSGLERRSGSAGRGAGSCGHSCRCIRYM